MKKGGRSVDAPVVDVDDFEADVLLFGKYAEESLVCLFQDRLFIKAGYDH
jgi:hypothetical protein